MKTYNEYEVRRYYLGDVLERKPEGENRKRSREVEVKSRLFAKIKLKEEERL